MFKLKNFAYLVCTMAIAHVCANSIRFYDAQDPFVPKGYDPVETMLPTDQRAQMYAGISFINYPTGTKNQNIGVSTTPTLETDTLAQFGDSGSLGFTGTFEGVRLYENSVKTTMRGFAYGLMVHVAPQTWTGEVYQFQQAINNNFTYSYKVRPIDFTAVLELYPTRFYSIHTMPFVVLGGGISMDYLNFQETPVPGTGLLPVSAAKRVTTPLGVVGAGLQFDMTNSWFVKTEYMYHYRGTVGLGVSTFVGKVPVNLNESSVDVMVGYRF